MNPLFRKTGAALVLALVFSGITVSTAEAKKISYKFRGGSMYTIEYSDSTSPPGTTANQTRWGRIDRKGRVKPLSGDLGLQQVTDADYSPVDGRVYVIAEAYTAACEIWSFDPDRPTATLSKLATVARPGFAPANCSALAVQAFTGDIAVAVGDDATSALFVNYYSPIDGSYVSTDSGFYSTPSDPYNALDLLEGRALSITEGGEYTYFVLMDKNTGTFSNPAGLIHSVRYDATQTPWILSWGSAVRVGRPSANESVINWGPVLKDSKKKRKWLSDTLVFIPR